MIQDLLTLWWVPVVSAPFVGSFLGVLVTRLPAREPVMWSRSRCPHCRHTLGAADLVPLVSWLAARGRCRYCSARVASFYPAMELAATGLALWAAAVVPAGAILWQSCVLAWTLLALAVIDWRHMILPDSLTLPLLAAGLAIAAMDGADALQARAIGAAVGLSAFLAVAWVYRQVRGREGLGAGDAKLLAAAGAWVAWPGLPGVVLWAAAAAFAVVLVRVVAGRPVTATERIAFGSFLSLGTWLVWLYGPLIITWPV